MIICIAAFLSCSKYAFAQVQVCKYTPTDSGDPESVQVAQLNAIQCLIETNRLQFKDGVDAIRSLHNDTVQIQLLILNAIKSQSSTNSSYSLSSIIGYILLSLVFSLIFHQMLKILWYFAIQKIDRIANLLLVYYHCRALISSASPSYDTLEDMRRSQPVPTLLVAIYCCRCKDIPSDV